MTDRTSSGSGSAASGPRTDPRFDALVRRIGLT